MNLNTNDDEKYKVQLLFDKFKRGQENKSKMQNLKSQSKKTKMLVLPQAPLKKEDVKTTIDKTKQEYDSEVKDYFVGQVDVQKSLEKCKIQFKEGGPKRDDNGTYKRRSIIGD